MVAHSFGGPLLGFCSIYGTMGKKVDIKKYGYDRNALRNFLDQWSAIKNEEFKNFAKGLKHDHLLVPLVMPTAKSM